VIVEDKLFATLDTRSRALRLPSGRDVIVTDTVGFIRDLPKDLFAAFRATFDETQDADLLLHVVDASDPCRSEHVETTEKLLVDLGLERIPRVLVFNKCDLLETPQPTLADRGVPISAVRPESLGPLVQAIDARLEASHPMLREEPTSSRPA
jgi:GTP-binding protein HflX